MTGVGNLRHRLLSPLRHRRLVTLAAATILVAAGGLVAALVVVNREGSTSISCATGASAATTPATASASAAAPLEPTSFLPLRMLDASHGWAMRVGWEPEPSASASAYPVDAAVMVTDDGGAHWRSVGLPVPDATLIGASDAAHAWVEGSPPDVVDPQTGVWQTSSCGATWTRLALPVTYASVTFLDPDHGFLMGVYYSPTASSDEFQESVALWETSDAGARWSAVTRVPPVKGPGPVALPDGCTPVGTGWSALSTGWIVGSCLTQPVLLVTHDGGGTWQPQALPIPPSVTLADLEPPTFTTPDDGEMVGLNTTSGSDTPCVYTTEDGGTTWSPQCGALPSPDVSVRSAMIAPDGTVVALLQDGTIAESTDGGRSWRTTGPPRPEVASDGQLLEDLVGLDFVDANHGFISLSSGALYATSDGGRTLHLVYQSPAAPLPGPASPPPGISFTKESPCPSSTTEPPAPSSCGVSITYSSAPP